MVVSFIWINIVIYTISILLGIYNNSINKPISTETKFIFTINSVIAIWAYLALAELYGVI